MGQINDYGQTLVRTDRERLENLIASLQERGVSLVYLASWHNPFGDLAAYAGKVFSAWRLASDAILVVFLRGEDRRWQVGARAGGKAAALLPQPGWEEVLSEARVEANRAQPAVAIANLAERLLDLLAAERTAAPQKRRSWGWAYALLALGAAGGLVFAARIFLCPKCLRPLRRRSSFRGILWVCPRCRCTRAGLR